MLTLVKISFSFYRKFVWPSILMNLLFVWLGVSLFLALMYKLVLTGLVLWTYRAVGGREQLVFYHNLKVSTTKLFVITLGWDLLILSGTFLIIGFL